MNLTDRTDRGNLLESVVTDGETDHVVEQHDEQQIIIAELGDRLLDECPVNAGDGCIDPECDGGIGEIERDPETQSAHELFCRGCGLNWVEHGNTWEESRAEWPTWGGDSS